MLNTYRLIYTERNLDVYVHVGSRTYVCKVKSQMTKWEKIMAAIDKEYHFYLRVEENLNNQLKNIKDRIFKRNKRYEKEVHKKRYSNVT